MAAILQQIVLNALWMNIFKHAVTITWIDCNGGKDNENIDI